MRSAVAEDPFAPLTGEPHHTTVAHRPEPVPVLPVPPHAGAPGLDHSVHGHASASWPYRSAEGSILGYAVRFDTPGGKQILPLTWCRDEDGRERWCWKALPPPRPLYGLDRLAARPDAPVLVSEGEKTADAAQQRFPDHVAITWPGGANAVAKADWTTLAGKTVVIWPDADEPGRKAADKISTSVQAAGATSVAIVQLPADLPEGWDLADPIPPDVDVVGQLDAAAKATCRTSLPAGYAFTSRGLVWRDPNDDEKPELHLAGSFEILAETRDAEGNSWGILLSWLDHDGRPHRYALPRALLAGDGADARRLLLDGGLYVAPGRKARELFTAFLVAAHSPNRVTATSRIGWHRSAFVLPDRSFGTRQGEDLLLQGAGAVEHAFRHRGTLSQWQDGVAEYASGNSRLVLALSAAFAAPLIQICDGESGGLHLRGASSTGKSTALTVAGSVWGGSSESGGFVRSWRATANGLESIALGHCDSLLCLDEMSQLPARDAGEVAYMLANGAGKSRSHRDGSARRAARWRVLFLSSGEIGLADKVAEDGRGRRPAAGQQVRVVDILADAGAGLGLFEELHGFPSADAFARYLKAASSASYGTAAPAFLETLVEDLAGVRSAVAAHIQSFVEEHVPAAADGQVQRVGQRFGLIAAGGEMATAAGVLPWLPGEATNAAARCFADWLDGRGGTESAEVRDAILQVRSFLQAHGISRFLPAWETDADRMQIRDLAGYRRREDSGWQYFITTSAWPDVCGRLGPRLVAKELAARGLLITPEAGPHRARLMQVPNVGKQRLYQISPSLLEGDGDE